IDVAAFEKGRVIMAMEIALALLRLITSLNFVGGPLRCPLLALGGHSHCTVECLLWGVKRTWCACVATSAKRTRLVQAGMLSNNPNRHLTLPANRSIVSYARVANGIVERITS